VTTVDVEPTVEVVAVVKVVVVDVGGAVVVVD